MKAAISIVVTAAVAIGGYLFLKPPAPCTQPIPYSIGSFDTRFGITKEKFLADIAAATDIWDAAYGGKSLFQYEPTASAKDSDLKVDLIYDYRQQATSKMQSLGITIKDNASSYESVKAKYDSLEASYSAERSYIESLKARYQSDKAAYDQQVSYWNARGGAPKAQYEAIEAQRANVNAEATNLNQSIAKLNDLVDSVNSAASVLNRIATNLNLNVKTYNSIGSSTGAEFDEGEYVQDASGRQVDIYQFSDNDMLVRVLAHEFGHALGLDHVTDPKAIMYKLNQSSNEKPTVADLTELTRVCGSPPKK